MVSLPGPRSPNRSIHRARSKLRGTRAGCVVQRLGHTCLEAPFLEHLGAGLEHGPDLVAGRGRARRRTRPETAPARASWRALRAASPDRPDDTARSIRACHSWPPGPAWARRALVAPRPAADVGRRRRSPRSRMADADRHGSRVRRLPQPFVTRLVSSDVDRSSTMDMGPPAKKRPPLVRPPSWFYPGRPGSPDALSSLNNRSTAGPIGTAPCRLESGPLVEAGQAWQVRGLPPLSATMSREGGGDVDGVAGPGALALREGAVQVADQALGVGEHRRRDRGPPGGRPRGE